MADVASLVLKVDSTDLSKSNDELKEFEKSAKDVEKAATAMGKTIGGIFVAAGSAIAVAVKASIDFADTMNDMQLRTGLAFKELAAYDQIARQSGTSIQGMADGFKFLGRYMVQHEDKLKSIGVTSKDSATAMAQFADVISGIKDPMLRASLAQEVLGRGGVALIPALMGGSKAFEDAQLTTKEYGEALEKTSPLADKFNDSLAELKTVAMTSGLEMAGKLLPGLTNIADAMKQAARESGFLKAALVGVGGVLSQIFTDNDLTRAQQISKELEKLRKEQSKYLDYGRGQNNIGRQAILSNYNDRMMVLQLELEAIQNAEKKISDTKISESEKAARKLVTKQETDKNAKARQKEFEDYINSQIKYAEGIDRETESIAKKIESIKLETESIGKSREEIDRIKASRYDHETQIMKEKLAILDSLNVTTAESAALKDAIKVREEYKTAMLDQATAQKAEDSAKKIAEANKKAAEESAKVWEEFSKNVQRNLGDVMYNAMNGKFTGIGDLFKQMLMRMAADAAAANITQSLFGPSGTSGGGLIGGIMNLFSPTPTGLAGMDQSAAIMSPAYSFAGGGYTGSGTRTGGIDGMGGFPAILHPNETVVDHSSGQKSGSTISINDNTVINIDSRSDENTIYKNVSRMIESGHAKLIDKLQRQGQLA